MSFKIHFTVFILAFVLAALTLAQSFTNLDDTHVRQKLQANGLIINATLS